MEEAPDQVKPEISDSPPDLPPETPPDLPPESLPDPPPDPPARTRRKWSTAIKVLAGLTVVTAIGSGVALLTLTDSGSLRPDSSTVTETFPVPESVPNNPALASQISEAASDVAEARPVLVNPVGLATLPDGRTLISDSEAAWVRPLGPDGLGPPMLNQSIAANAGLSNQRKPGLIATDTFGAVIIASFDQPGALRLDTQGTLSEWADTPRGSVITALGADQKGNVAIAWASIDSSGAFVLSALGDKTEFISTPTISAFLAVSNGSWFGAVGEQLVPLRLVGEETAIVAPVPPILPGTGTINAVQVLPKGWLAISRERDQGSGSGGLWFWDSAANVAVAPISQRSVGALTVSSTGRLLAVDTDLRQVVEVDPTNPVTASVVLSSTAAERNTGPQLATDAVLKPHAVEFLSDGGLVVVERDKNQVLAVVNGVIRPFTAELLTRPSSIASTTYADGTRGIAIASELSANQTKLTVFAEDGTVVNTRDLDQAPGPLSYDETSRLLLAKPDGSIARLNSKSLQTETTIIGAAGHQISALTVDPTGSIFVATRDSNEILRIDATGTTTQVLAGAGDPFAGNEADPTSFLGVDENTVATVSGLVAIGPDRLVVSDYASDRVLIVIRTDQGWTVSPFRGTTPVDVVASPLSQRLANPSTLAVSQTGAVAVVLGPSGVVKNINPGGTSRTVAGGGLPNAAPFGTISGITLVDGLLTISDATRHRVISVKDGERTLIAGTGVQGSDDRDLDSPQGVASSNGSVYVADTLNHRIVSVDQGGVSTRILGTGIAGQSSLAGLGPTVAIYEPSSVAVNSAGDLIVADTGNNRVLRVTLDGRVSLVGNVNRPGGIAVVGSAADERVIVSSARDHQVVSIAKDGRKSTIAGIGTRGAGGDGGRATSAQLDSPAGLAVAPDGSVLVADYGTRSVRRISPSGFITTVTGANGEFVNPRVILLDVKAGLIIGDLTGRLFRVEPELMDSAAPGWKEAASS